MCDARWWGARCLLRGALLFCRFTRSFAAGAPFLACVMCLVEGCVVSSGVRVDDGPNNVSRWMTWLPISLKNAAKCDKWYELQKPPLPNL